MGFPGRGSCTREKARLQGPAPRPGTWPSGSQFASPVMPGTEQKLADSRRSRQLPGYPRVPLRCGRNSGSMPFWATSGRAASLSFRAIPTSASPACLRKAGHLTLGGRSLPRRLLFTCSSCLQRRSQGPAGRGTIPTTPPWLARTALLLPMASLPLGGRGSWVAAVRRRAGWLSSEFCTANPKRQVAAALGRRRRVHVLPAAG